MTDNAELLPCPEGWRLVPVEPTPEMTEKALEAGSRYGVKAMANIWSLMLSAAPVPASPPVADVTAALRAEIERQCGIGAGTFVVDDGRDQSGLWQINADLDPYGLSDALSTRPRVSREDVIEALRPLSPTRQARAGDAIDLTEIGDAYLVKLADAILALFGGGE